MVEQTGATLKKALGQRLVEAGLITPGQLETALHEQQRTGEQLGHILQELGFISEENLSDTLSAEMGMCRVSLESHQFSTQVINLVSARTAREHQLIPLAVEDGTLSIAMADVCDIVAVDAVQRETGFAVKALAASPREIRTAIARYYPDSGSHNARVEELIQEARSDTALQSEEEAAGRAPIMELVDQLILKGIKDGATDIHIEPEEKLVRTRYRLDGILHQGPPIPKSLQAAIISRLKVLADLDISERRIPQDGRIRFAQRGSAVDLRISIYPTAHGENIVLRVLDRSTLSLRLERLGFSDAATQQLKSLVNRPHGMILVTGPTGSGKTTSLYSLLAEIDAIEKNVVTIEDPIEYQLSMIRQSQVNPKIGLTFAAGLRALLRQDPDVILVGEVRDIETARIAVSAALTGHIVLTTLHTNTAAGALPRLIDMGIEPFLLSSAVSGVLAQRLVRTLCRNCKQAYEPGDSEIETLKPVIEMRKAAGIEIPAEIKLFRGSGCPSCRESGYRGRTVIYELITLTEDTRKLVLNQASAGAIAEAAQAQGMRSMFDTGIEKVLDGQTTIEEVMRVCRTMA